MAKFIKNVLSTYMGKIPKAIDFTNKDTQYNVILCTEKGIPFIITGAKISITKSATLYFLQNNRNLYKTDYNRTVGYKH